MHRQEVLVAGALHYVLLAHQDLESYLRPWIFFGIFCFYQAFLFLHLISEPSEKYKLNHATFHKLLVRQSRLS